MPRLRVRWTNGVTLDSLGLWVYRADGTEIGTVVVPKLAAGARVWDWDGKIGGVRVQNGSYYVTLTVTDNEGKRASTSKEVCVPTISCSPGPLP